MTPYPHDIDEDYLDERTLKLIDQADHERDARKDREMEDAWEEMKRKEKEEQP